MNEILFSTDLTQDELLNQDTEFNNQDNTILKDSSLDDLNKIYNHTNIHEDITSCQDISNLYHSNCDNSHSEHTNTNNSDNCIQQPNAIYVEGYNEHTPHLVSLHSDSDTIYHEHSGTVYHEHYFRKKTEHVTYGDTNDGHKSLPNQNESSEETHTCVDNNHDGVCDNNSGDD